MLQQLAPYFGYLASLFLIISLMVNNGLQFRWYNTLGCLAFVIYAIVIKAFPVLLTNTILLSINIFYLYKIYSKTENFDLLEFNGEEKLAQKFLSFYKDDIESYFPGFNENEIIGKLNFVVIRDLVIANIFSASLSEGGDANVLINFTVEKYRDYKIGTFIFEKERDYLISKGVKRIVYDKVSNVKHAKFLKVMGFTKTAEGQFIKSI
ncbi:MAG: hypothetical protein ABI091_20355 [Ferruginibacter sp.]